MSWGVRHKFNETNGAFITYRFGKNIRPEPSLLPASKEPIITQEAPMASALVAHPVELIPPSAMTGMPCLAAIKLVKYTALSLLLLRPMTKRLC